jgi:hypothetical protein
MFITELGFVRSCGIGFRGTAIEQAAADDRFARDLAIDIRFALHATCVAAPHQNVHLDPKLIAGNHRPAELGTLNGSEQQELVFAVGELSEQEDTAGLRHGFYH